MDNNKIVIAKMGEFPQLATFQWYHTFYLLKILCPNKILANYTIVIIIITY